MTKLFGLNGGSDSGCCRQLNRSEEIALARKLRTKAIWPMLSLGLLSDGLCYNAWSYGYKQHFPKRKQHSLLSTIVKMLIAFSVCLCLLSPLASPSWAADDLTGEPIPEVMPFTSINPQPDTGDIPSEMVSKFVKAYLAVVNLVGRRETELQRVETETESLQLQEQIQAEAFQLIEQAGITQQEYWQLLGLANIDPDFRERVLAQVEETNL